MIQEAPHVIINEVGPELIPVNSELPDDVRPELAPVNFGVFKGLYFSEFNREEYETWNLVYKVGMAFFFVAFALVSFAAIYCWRLLNEKEKSAAMEAKRVRRDRRASLLDEEGERDGDDSIDEVGPVRVVDPDDGVRQSGESENATEESCPNDCTY